MYAAVFPRGGVSSRAARTGRSRSGSSDRLSQSPPRAPRSGRRGSAAGRACLPARPDLRRSFSGALSSGISPRSTAGCTGRRAQYRWVHRSARKRFPHTGQTASRFTARPPPQGHAKKTAQNKLSFLYAKSAHDRARYDVLCGRNILFYYAPHQEGRRTHRCGSLCAEGLEAHGVTSFYRLFMQQNFPSYRALLSYRFFPAGAISTPGNFKRLRAAAFPWRFSVLIIPCPAPSRAMISFFRSCRFLWDSSACSPAVSEKRGPFPPTKKDRLVSGLFFIRFIRSASRRSLRRCEGAFLFRKSP